MEKIASGIWRISIGQPEAYTPSQYRDRAIRLEDIAKLPAQENSPLMESDFSFHIGPRGCRVEYDLHQDEKIYGLGLQLKSTNQRGRKKQLRVNSDPVADTGDSHAPVPFYVSTAGYGIFIDTARYVTLYCGTHKRAKSAHKRNESQSHSIGENPDELYVGSSPREEEPMIIEVPEAQGVDLYLFAGPTVKHVIQRYNLFSGGGCLPPYWGLGIWYRTYGKYEMKSVLKQAAEFRERNIPCDVYGLEPGWQSHAYSCSYTWDNGRFPQPAQLIASLTDMDYKINLWEHVFVHPTSPIYEKLLDYAGNYEVWGGLVPDLSLKEAKDIFGGYHQQYLIDQGISGFKLDECDNSDYIRSPWSFPEASAFPSGMDGEQMHSFLGILYQRILMSIYREQNKRTYSQVRSSHGLASSLPFVLYSDLYYHRDFIRGVVNMGFSGLLWSPEVRQCESVEDLIRRIQTVIFSPQALINAWMIKNPPWLQVEGDKNNREEFMENHEEVEGVCRDLLRLRMSLIPYLYSSFARYYFEGIPPFRALVVDYPSDENTYSIDDSYLMGESILVAPMVAGQQSREVYLPEGCWYSFWDHTRYEGGRTYTIEGKLTQIPVFVKENSLLPLAEPVDYIKDDTIFDMHIYKFGEGDSSYMLYEDDGYSFDYEKGAYNHITLKWLDGKSPEISHSGSFKGRKYRIVDWKSIK